MTKYINADELMEIIKAHHYILANAINSRDYGMFTPGIEQAISETKSIEIVRCKDCKYSYYCDEVEEYCCKLTEFDDFVFSHSADFYCADGERKETE